MYSTSVEGSPWVMIMIIGCNACASKSMQHGYGRLGMGTDKAFCQLYISACKEKKMLTEEG